MLTCFSKKKVMSNLYMRKKTFASKIYVDKNACRINQSYL